MTAFLLLLIAQAASLTAVVGFLAWVARDPAFVPLDGN